MCSSGGSNAVARVEPGHRRPGPGTTPWCTTFFTHDSLNCFQNRKSSEPRHNLVSAISQPYSREWNTQAGTTDPSFSPDSVSIEKTPKEDQESSDREFPSWRSGNKYD